MKHLDEKMTKEILSSSENEDPDIYLVKTNCDPLLIKS